MKSFTITDVQRKYGISRKMVTDLVREGFIDPVRGRRREYRFCFNDVIVMRKAQQLHAAGIPPRMTTRFLRQLGKESSGGYPPANLRISTAGKELVLREEGRLRNAEGQLVIDFAENEQIENVLSLTPAGYPNLGPNFSAAGWFHAAMALEESDPLRAVEYYQRAIEIDQKYADAYINLSCLLIEGEQYIEAFAVCQEALAQCPQISLLYFNMGVVYEELDSTSNALKCYKAAISLDPGFGDAHYNAARLHEVLDQPKAAIRHYSAYHRLRR